MKIVKSLKESGLLRKGVSEKIKNKTKRTKNTISWNIIIHFRY